MGETLGDFLKRIAEMLRFFKLYEESNLLIALAVCLEEHNIQDTRDFDKFNQHAE